MGKLKLLLVALFAAILFAAPKAHADVNDFVINDFHGKYELSEDTHGGRMTVTETIQLTFSDQNHGILRAIPEKYKKNSLKLKVLSIKRDGSQEPYSTYGQGSNEVLKIGDADKTITGPHTYEIRYEMQGIISFYEKYDEWYWDINGDQWGQPFDRVSGEVVLPAGWSDEGLPRPSCYTGHEGSTEQACTIERTTEGYKFEAGRDFLPRETLTVAFTTRKGLFVPRDSLDWYRDNSMQLVGLAAGLGLSFVAFRQWWRYGKDYKGRGVIIPEYQPPKGLSPAEAGMLADYRVDGRDLSATIIDLSVRGYIKIRDDEKKTLGLFKKHEFSLELVKDDLSKLKPHEKQLVEALFSSATIGTIQKIADIDKAKMYKTVTSIRGKLKNTLKKEHGLIEETPGKSQLKLWAILIGSFILVVVAHPGWGWILGFIVAILTSVACLALMQRRSHAGVEAYEKIKGLELYMNTAEKDRLKMMQSVDRPYAEPAKTVHLFEKLLPFAIALGVEKSWANQFEGIYKEPPGWYSGNYTAFNTAYFVSSLNSGVSAMNSSFTASSSSGGSGSGGGGFSGGGGGGGGGGGW